METLAQSRPAALPWVAACFILCLCLCGCTDRGTPSPSGPAKQANPDLTRALCVPGSEWTLYYDRYTGEPFSAADLILDTGSGPAYFTEGLVPARRVSRLKGGLAGYVDATGRVVIPFQFDSAEPFSEGRAVTCFHGKAGLIDGKGHWVVPPGRYENIWSVTDGRCGFKTDGKWGFLDRDGAVIVPPVYRDFPTGYTDGLCIVQDDAGRYVCIDPDGHKRFDFPAEITDVHAFSNGLARVVCRPPLGDGYGYIDTTGNLAIKAVYRQAGDFSEGLAPVSINAEQSFNDDASSEYERPPGKNDAWGFVDTRRQLIIPYMFKRVGQFHCGLARAMQDNKWGYIDCTGRFVIPPTYYCVYDFCDGVAMVDLDGYFAFIDLSGRLIVKTDKEVVNF